MNHNDEEIDFNIPEEVTAIFRIPERDGSKSEYAGKRLICWEDIMGIEEYPFEDDWKKFPGEKYQISVHGDPNECLVLGSYEEAKDKWFHFRITWPVFRKEPF